MSLKKIHQFLSQNTLDFKDLSQYLSHTTDDICSIMKRNEKTDEKLKTPQTQYLRAFERI